MIFMTLYGPPHGDDSLLCLEGLEAAASRSTRSLTLNSLGLTFEL